MQHLQRFRDRELVSFPVMRSDGWRLKRYVICWESRSIDESVIAAASAAACRQLPLAGTLDDPESNHGIGFQIIHFAQVAVVSPVFFWQWGSVLSNIVQLRAPWTRPTEFSVGIPGIVGCVWEMQLVSFEVATWTKTMLNGSGHGQQNSEVYLKSHFPSARSLEKA